MSKLVVDAKWIERDRVRRVQSRHIAVRRARVSRPLPFCAQARASITHPHSLLNQILRLHAHTILFCLNIHLLLYIFPLVHTISLSHQHTSGHPPTFSHTCPRRCYLHAQCGSVYSPKCPHIHLPHARTNELAQQLHGQHRNHPHSPAWS
jgi:hypothetical protein